MGTRKLKTKKNRGNYIVSNRDGMRILDESHNFPKELPPDFMEFTKVLVLGPAPHTAEQLAEWRRLRPYIEAMTAEEQGSVVSWSTAERAGRTRGMQFLQQLHAEHVSRSRSVEGPSTEQCVNAQGEAWHKYLEERFK